VEVVQGELFPRPPTRTRVTTPLPTKVTAQTFIRTPAQERLDQWVRIGLQRSRSGFLGPAQQPPSFVKPIPDEQNIETWSAARYGLLGQPPEITAVPALPWWMHRNPDLDERETEVRRTLRALDWPVGVMVSFVKHADYVRSAKAADRAAKIAGFHDEERLVVPIEPHLDAAYGTVPETITDNRCLLVSLMPGVVGTFLAAWLNSSHCRRIRAAAMPYPGSSPRTVSSGDLMRLLDALVVPVPSLDKQAAIGGAALMLRDVRQRAGQLTEELWRTPSAVREIQLITSHWLEATDITPQAVTSIEPEQRPSSGRYHSTVGSCPASNASWTPETSAAPR
jgi:hypothetical protein